MNIYYLTVELIVDAIALSLGISLIYKKNDNLPKFYWGVISALIGLVFIWENIGWVNMRTQNPTYEYGDILNIEKMTKFYMLASVVSLYPLASLRPGYLTKFRVVLCLIPPIVITTIGTCYLFFNGNTTPLDSISQIGSNMNQIDVRLRLTIFIFTIITPLIYFLYPLMRANNGQRKINNMMYVFIGFMFSLLGIYILFTLFICDLFFNGFGAISILFAIFFSVQYLRKESPLSDHVEIANIVEHRKSEEDDAEETVMETIIEPTILPLFQSIDNYLKENPDYANSKFTIEQLSKSIRESETNISQAIKSAGYSGFREYINKLRLEHFRDLILEDPHRTTKELWIECGFSSKATFYRQFSLEYNEAPRDFIEKQRGT